MNGMNEASRILDAEQVTLLVCPNEMEKKVQKKTTTCFITELQLMGTGSTASGEE